MRYWWVNQNQTFDYEVGGGYLWSPKHNSNGAKNQFYNNMQLVERGDIILSFAGTFIRAIGIALGPAFESEKPPIFGQAGEYWASDGWRVPVEFSRVENPIRPKEHMRLLLPLLPAKYSPLTRKGNGLQGVYLAEIPQEMGQILLGLLKTPELVLPVYHLEDLAFSAEEQTVIADRVLKETEKATLVMARRGQGIFRNRVKVLEPCCRVTGITADKLLIASHIKPWADSDNQERLDGNNGLFLSPHVDRLFDAGFISFTQKGEMLVSPKLDLEVLPKWNIDSSANYGRFNGEQAYFLDFHQTTKFVAA